MDRQGDPEHGGGGGYWVVRELAEVEWSSCYELIGAGQGDGQSYPG